MSFGPKRQSVSKCFQRKENICCFTLSLLYFLNKYNTPQQFTQLAVLAWLCFALGFSPSEMLAHPQRASSNGMVLISPFSDEFLFLLNPYLPLVEICLHMALLKCKQQKGTTVSHLFMYSFAIQTLSKAGSPLSTGETIMNR